MTLKINGITYQVVRSFFFDANGKKREELILKRPNGTKTYAATKYENGSISSVVSL